MNILKWLFRSKQNVESEDKPKVYQSEIRLSHAKGEVVVTVESVNSKLAAHVSNSIKSKFGISGKSNRIYTDEDTDKIEKIMKDFEYSFTEGYRASEADYN